MSFIVLTRPLAQAKRFADQLPDTLKDKCDILFSPLLDIKHLDVQEASAHQEVIFTSENGVEAFVAQHNPKGRRAFCVGDRTAQAARDAGFDAISGGGTSGGLIELVAAEGGGEILYARGEFVARDLAGELAELGIPVKESIVYSQFACALSKEVQDLVSGDADVIFPLFSPRTMRLLCEAIKQRGNANLVAVCMSENVANAAQPGVFGSKHVCAAPNSASIVATLERVIA